MQSLPFHVTCSLIFEILKAPSHQFWPKVHKTQGEQSASIFKCKVWEAELTKSSAWNPPTHKTANWVDPSLDPTNPTNVLGENFGFIRKNPTEQ